MSLCWLTMWKVSFIFFPSVDSYFHIWKQTNLRRIMLAVDTLFLFCVFCVADFGEFLTIFKYFLCSLFNLCLSTFPLEKTLATFWSNKLLRLHVHFLVRSRVWPDLSLQLPQLHLHRVQLHLQTVRGGQHQCRHQGSRAQAGGGLLPARAVSRA